MKPPAPVTTTSLRGSSSIPPPRVDRVVRLAPFLAGLEVMLLNLAPLTVVIHHHADELREADRRSPAELLLRLRRVSEHEIDLGRTEIALVDRHVVGPVEPCVGERLIEELAHGVRLPSGEDVVVRLVRLEHSPDTLHVVAREPPVALRVEVSEPQRILLAAEDRTDRARDLPRDERRATARRFMVEEDPVHRVHPVRLAVVARDPVAEDLADPVRAARV